MNKKKVELYRISFTNVVIVKAFNFSILTAATFLLQHTEAATGGVL